MSGDRDEHELRTVSRFDEQGHRFLYTCLCSCGWVSSDRKVSESAALRDGDDHREAIR